MKKKLITLTLLCALLMSLMPQSYASTNTATASVPTFNVTLNGVQMNPSQSEYPLLVYKDITYVPMTYNLAHGLGLNVNFTSEDGLSIDKASADVTIKEYLKQTKNASSVRAILPNYKIKVNGIIIDNSKEQYPIITYNNITYFPLTWHFVVDEFNWNMSFSSEKGLVITSQSGTIETTTDETAIVEEDFDKNIYTQEYLQKLVDTINPDDKVTAFRATPNPRRNGQNKIEGKYFDMYYPDGEAFENTAKLLEPHMDMVYMLLSDLYGYQANVEVHLIDPTTVSSSEEGNIRNDEGVTFIWIEENNDGVGGINNIAELVHEMNHNFFEGKSEEHVGSRKMWINEAHAKLVASLYTHYLPKEIDKNIQQYSFYNPVTDRTSNIIVAEDKYLVIDNGDAWKWYPRDSEEHLAQLSGLKFWWNVYNQNDLDTFKSILRQLDVNRPALEVMTEITGMTKEELNEKFMK